jgi:hypothetical protein
MAGASEGETWSPGDLAECITACAWIDGDGARHPGPQLREIRMVIDIAFLPRFPNRPYLVFARYDPRTYRADHFRKVVPRADEASRATADFIAGLTPARVPEPATMAQRSNLDAPDQLDCPAFRREHGAERHERAGRKGEDHRRLSDQIGCGRADGSLSERSVAHAFNNLTIGACARNRPIVPTQKWERGLKAALGSCRQGAPLVISGRVFLWSGVLGASARRHRRVPPVFQPAHPATRLKAVGRVQHKEP